MIAIFGAGRPLGGVLLAVAAVVAAYVLRYRFIEPEALGAACYGGGPWWCAPRAALIAATEVNGFGWLSLALVAAALLLPRGAPLSAHLALAIGGSGLILYNASVSAVAVVAALLWLAAQRPGEAAQFRR